MTSADIPQDRRWAAFDTLAPTYQARPDYREEALDELEAVLSAADEPQLIIDVGAGTGIFTRQLAHRYPHADTVGLEPNSAMREIASATGAGGTRYLDGQSSAIPFADGCAAVVAAASALHRFDRDAFYAEAARILRPDGILMIIDNLPRPWGSRFHSEYLAYQEAEVPAYRRGRNSDGFGGYIDLDPIGDLKGLPQFADVSYGLWPFDDDLDHERLMALVQSSSINQSVMASIGRDVFLDRIQGLYRNHVDTNGMVQMSFVTTAVYGRRSGY
ncbi:methyltransferase domain-containing protein [Rhizobium calliandrae]|uniref:Methyltransferase domain-containing protein n=1 Tax=Rhizobium calliandrae TaxID=1312182 RepID=A0ABT7KIY6_9HYPH|nr:methyltransferase domain-containing protein [Rhizobium calliandrae]MDL2408594.1 methyltransferase domain-containing protein [Rhizobium calliandrae]